MGRRIVEAEELRKRPAAAQLDPAFGHAAISLVTQSHRASFVVRVVLTFAFVPFPGSLASAQTVGVRAGAPG
jgi:hypothetical protein